MEEKRINKINSDMKVEIRLKQDCDVIKSITLELEHIKMMEQVYGIDVVAKSVSELLLGVDVKIDEKVEDMTEKEFEEYCNLK